MTEHNETQAWKTDLFEFLTETFESVQGIYLDRGTSLFETLESVTAEEASRRISSQCACLAAQVNHVCYYLEVLTGYMIGQQPENVDWPGSWNVTSVTPDEWAVSLQRLRDAYQQVRTHVERIDTWNSEAYAIVVHTAYHLGEIRQGLGVLRG